MLSQQILGIETLPLKLVSSELGQFRAACCVMANPKAVIPAAFSGNPGETVEHDAHDGGQTIDAERRTEVLE